MAGFGFAMMAESLRKTNRSLQKKIHKTEGGRNSVSLGKPLKYKKASKKYMDQVRQRMQKAARRKRTISVIGILVMLTVTGLVFSYWWNHYLT